MKICYLGSDMPQYLSKEYYNIDLLNIDQLDICKVIDIYDILVIEISSENIERVLKWVFRLYCKKKIPIFAMLIGCNNADKILLNKFGITDYIDAVCDTYEIKRKWEAMIRRINWKKIK